jgi:hypothetical protein
MNQDIIEVRIYDQSHTKLFQFSAQINSRKAMKELYHLLQQKGISMRIGKEDTDFF